MLQGAEIDGKTCQLILSYCKLQHSSRRILVHCHLSIIIIYYYYFIIIIIIIMSAPMSQPNNMGQMSVRPYVHPSVRPSVHKKFFRFR